MPGSLSGRRPRRGLGLLVEALAPPSAAIELVLPAGDGVELCRRLREWTQMPLLVLSAVGDDDAKVRRWPRAPTTT